MTKPKSPFAALEALRDKLPAGPAKTAEPAKAAPLPTTLGEKVVVARSKKGRGGKTVTTIAGIRDDAREALAHDLRRALGCGATVEAELVVVQGDQAIRVRSFLESRGVRQVILGN